MSTLSDTYQRKQQIQQTVNAEATEVVGQLLASTSVPLQRHHLETVLEAHCFNNSFINRFMVFGGDECDLSLGDFNKPVCLTPSGRLRWNHDVAVRNTGAATDRFMATAIAQQTSQLPLLPPRLKPLLWLDVQVLDGNWRRTGAIAELRPHVARLMGMEPWHNGFETDYDDGEKGRSYRMVPHEGTSLWLATRFSSDATNGWWCFVTKGSRAWHLFASDMGYDTGLRFDLFPA